MWYIKARGLPYRGNPRALLRFFYSAFFCLPNLLSAYIQFILQHKPCVGYGALDVPLLVCLSNSTLSAQRSAYFFKTLYGTTFSHTARIHKFMNNQTLPLRAGCRISVSLRTEISPSPYIWKFADTVLWNKAGERCSPLRILGIVYYAAKSLRSLRILLCTKI